MERHLLYIINPISGTRNKDALLNLVERKTNVAGFRYSIFPSVANTDYGHLHPFIKGQKVTDVIVGGGDGTVNQVINSFKNLDVQFGILPVGSGNGLAFGAKLPKNIEKALDIVFAGKKEWTDAYEINEKFACMLCGLGFDAQVAHAFANNPTRGLATYIRKTITNFFSATAYPFVIKTGDDELEIEALFISIANSNQFGNNFTIAPKASLTDGLLDVVIVSKQTKLRMLMETIRQAGGFNKLYTAKIADAKASVLYFQTDALQIKNPLLAPLHIDGDPAKTSEEINVKILKNCFRLIYP
jgi:YegS/Rv2252/BmrU family lipid kinase